MAYKRNPMRSERICSLGRYAQSLSYSLSFTHSTQWFERTLDDSANKRLSVPQAFLALDAMLILAENISAGLVVYPKMIERHVNAELPFMATENILMAGVKKGGDRQALHEWIRQHSMEAAKKVKEEGQDNDLLQRIAADTRFKMNLDELLQTLNPTAYIGRCPEQVEYFLTQVWKPMKEKYRDWENLELESLRV